MKYIIVVDKQPRSNPSAEKRETTIEIEELRRKGDIHDDFKIEKGIARVYRRIGLTKYHVTYVLDKEVIEELGELKISLFKGNNYIYIKDEYNNPMCAEFVIQNEFNDRFVTNLEMSSAIEQNAQQILLNVTQILEGYSDTETTKAMIDIKADEIREEVSRDYATQDALEQEKTERVQTANSITQTVSLLKETVKNDYSTTTQMNSAITQKANEITSSVSSTYETKTNASNTYATKAQLTSAKSEIKQTTDSISSTVSKKVGIDEIISRINQSAEKIAISADKIDIDGKAVHFKTNISKTIGPFTKADRQKMIDYILGKTTLTSEEFKKYDVNNDGDINSFETYIASKAIANGGYYTFTGTYEIDPNSINRSIALRNNNGNYEAIISLMYNYFKSLCVGGLETKPNEDMISSAIQSHYIGITNNDSTNSVIMQVGDWYNSKKTSGISISSGVNGKFSSIDIVTQEDTAFIEINSAKVQSCKNLYNNSSGTAGTVTLSESASNARCIEIFYYCNGYRSIKVDAPNGKDVELQTGIWNADTTLQRYKLMKISGTSITPISGYTGTLNTWNNSVTSENIIKITKVVMYV